MKLTKMTDKSVYTSFFHSQMRHTLTKHMAKRGKAYGYNSVVKDLLHPSRLRRYSSERSEEFLKFWEWDVVRDIVTKGRRVSDKMLELLIDYLKEVEPEQVRRFDGMGAIQSIGEALCDFYLSKNPGADDAYSGALVRQKASGLYIASIDPPNGRIGWRSDAPLRASRILSMYPMDGYDFLVCHQFNLCLDGSEFPLQLYYGLGLIHGPNVMLHLRQARYNLPRCFVASFEANGFVQIESNQMLSMEHDPLEAFGNFLHASKIETRVTGSQRRRSLKTLPDVTVNVWDWTKIDRTHRDYGKITEILESFVWGVIW